MLSEEEKREIRAEWAHYPHKRAACVEALKIIQRRRQWISDESLRDLADFLEMTAEELDNVATFYNLIFRKSVGRHVILVCDSVTCWIMGSEDLRTRLGEILGIGFGGTTADQRFTLLPMACLGTCDHAPAMMIDNDLYRDIDTDSLGKILERHP